MGCGLLRVHSAKKLGLVSVQEWWDKDVENDITICRWRTSSKYFKEGQKIKLSLIKYQV